MSFWILQILNGLSYGALLFLLASGLSLVFGLMRLINLAHGSFYLVGAYIGLTTIQYTGNFFLAMLFAGLGVGIIGALLQRLILHRYQHNELAQVLLTFGILLIMSDGALWIWGGLPQTLPTPAIFDGPIHIGPVTFPIYRIVIIFVGFGAAALLWLFLDRTTLGSIVRAGVDDEQMVRGMGINMPNVFTGVFFLGASMAAIGGVLGGPIIGVHPGLDFEIMLLAFVVVVIGGLGSLRGAFFSSMLIGLIDNFGKALFPEFALFTIFIPMAIVLAVRPTGLFGRA